MNPRYANFPQKIVDIASATEKSLGRTLYNLLPSAAQAVIRNTTINPRDKTMSEEEIATWINDHVVMRGEHEIIGIRDGDDVFWDLDLNGKGE